MSDQQQILDLTLPRRRALGRDDFLVSEANEAALRLIDGWRAWPNLQLALSGPEGAGKTHLAHVWMEATGAERIAAAALRDGDAVALASIGAVVVEDVDRDADQTALFHLMNIMRAEEKPLLMTMRRPPAKATFALKDLASRINGMTHIAIALPDQRLFRDLLIKQFRDRHLVIGDRVAEFLVRRLERSPKAAASAVAVLDSASRAEARAITIPLIKRHLQL